MTSAPVPHFHYAWPHGSSCSDPSCGPCIPVLEDGRCGGVISCSGCYPKPEIKELDFSHFHDLEHLIGGNYCWHQYGGPWMHIVYWWQFKSPWAQRRIQRLFDEKYNQ